jgi:hypothetical protein
MYPFFCAASWISRHLEFLCKIVASPIPNTVHSNFLSRSNEF